MKIFKYLIPLQDNFTLEMPFGAKILSFQTQNNTPHIWALVNPNKELETRHFSLIPTGEHFSYAEDVMKYIGTAQMNHPAFVIHLFEDLNE